MNHDIVPLGDNVTQALNQSVQGRSQPATTRPTRYVIVGTGGRALMYTDAIADRYRSTGELVGLCDPSPTRMAFHNRRLRERFGLDEVPTFTPSQFVEMLERTRADAVIVACIDSKHHHYVIDAVKHGRRVICEKPLTTDVEKLRAIVGAANEHDSQIQVTFNLRYAPFAVLVKSLLLDNVIGRVLAVNLQWVLDVRHGADYFRRWHRDRSQSGGLLVTKSCHHFDLVNWWLNDQPKQVVATGGLYFYGSDNAARRGHAPAYKRYTGTDAAGDDPFRLCLDQDHDLEDELYRKDVLQGLYLDAEVDSGYLRDSNVFGEGISIEDTMNLLVRYQNGVVLNYSLLAYSPWEGFRVELTGEKGRIELHAIHRWPTTGKQGSIPDNAPPGACTAKQPRDIQLRVFPMFEQAYDVPVPQGEAGTHGGADPAMLGALLNHLEDEDPLKRVAGLDEGVQALLIGLGGNESIQTGKPVNCHSLL